MLVRDESTPEAREIWAKVDRGAREVPEWMRPHIEKVAANAGRRIEERLKRMQAEQQKEK